MEIWYLLTIFNLACFIGFFCVKDITPALHSPLMSVANAISGIVILGALISLENYNNTVSAFLSYLACFFAAVNIFGGFAISQRMLEMFKTGKNK